VKRENARLIWWLLALGTVVTLCVPLLNFFGNTFVGGEDILQRYVQKYEFGFLTEYLLYYLAGWYLTHVAWDKKYRLWLYAAGAVGFLLTAGLTAWFSTPDNRLYDLFYANGSVNVFFFSAAVFAFVLARCEGKTVAKDAPVARLSALSFGVYIVHIVVLAVVSRVGALLPGALLPMLFNFVVTFVVSYAVVWVLSKLPLLKRLVRQ
jgi:surface polysaccharide O-acyltransferase-like enzyme